MDNPYQDVLDISKKPMAIAKKKQYFAHTDNNLAGISNLTKDEDLILANIENKNYKGKNAHHNNSSAHEEGIPDYYFYPQKFPEHEQKVIPDFAM